MTPDCSGIAGRIASFANLYEAHSFAGHGVMRSYGAARSTASLLATGDWTDVDLAPLTRECFTDPARWIPEDLHI